MRKIHLVIAFCFVSLFLWNCGNKTSQPAEVIQIHDSLSEKLNSPELKELNAFLVKDPENASLYNKRALIYVKLKQYDEAIGDALRAVAIDSTKAEYYITMADVYFAFNKSRASKETLEATVKKFPESTEAHLKLAELFFLVRQYEPSITEINKALKIDENIAKAYYLKGCVFKEMGDTAKAVSSMATAVEQDNKYFEAFVDLGLLHAVKRNPLAFQYFENALRLKPNNELVMYAVAKLLQDLKKDPESIAQYEKILSFNKNHTQSLYNIGAIYLERKKDPSKAIEYFTKAITIDPKYTEAYFARGVCFELMGDVQNAKADYNMSLQITPNFEPSIEALNNLSKK